MRRARAEAEVLWCVDTVRSVIRISWFPDVCPQQSTSSCAQRISCSTALRVLGPSIVSRGARICSERWGTRTQRWANPALCHLGPLKGEGESLKVLQCRVRSRDCTNTTVSSKEQQGYQGHQQTQKEEFTGCLNLHQISPARATTVNSRHRAPRVEHVVGFLPKFVAPKG